MRIAIISASICLITAFTAPRETPASAGHFKDRAAMLIYEGRDRVLARLPFADSANLALIILKQQQGDTVSQSQLVDRPCVGVALFSKQEWADLAARGRTPSEVRPSEAALRLRLYPATKNARAVVVDIREATAFVAVGLERMQNPPPPKTRSDSSRLPFQWSVQKYLDSARGPCTAE